MKRIAVLMLVLVSGCGGAPRVTVEDGVETTERVEVIAHRGASGAAPENTMAAFREAHAAGADMIELDVQLLRDGQLAVFHDHTLGRTAAGSRPFPDLTAAECALLDAGSWFDARFAGERIPMFDQVLLWSAGRIPLNVELKISGGGEPAVALARAAVDLVVGAHLERETIFSSFDPVAAAEAARRCPECEVALLWNGSDGSTDPFPTIDRIGARALHLPLRALSPEVARVARERGLPLRVYTLDTEPDVRQALELGAAAIITNYPGRVRAWLEGPGRVER
jgi:glycerophosphoryl diester phosphodiesterase